MDRAAKGDDDQAPGSGATRLRLFRTTAFKLSLIYLCVFAVFATSLIGYISSSMDELVETQVRDAVDRELKSLAGY